MLQKMKNVVCGITLLWGIALAAPIDLLVQNNDAITFHGEAVTRVWVACNGLLSSDHKAKDIQSIVVEDDAFIIITEDRKEHFTKSAIKKINFKTNGTLEIFL